MKQILPCIALLRLLLFSHSIQAQTLIPLVNPSFESEAPNVNTVPKGWNSFVSTIYDYPDLLPGEYNVSAKPQAGNVFVGLRSRGNGICEGLGQQLSQPLQMDSIYILDIWLAHASKYIVPAFKKGKQHGTVTCNGFTALQVLGLNSKTRSNEVLAETSSIDHDEWRKYTLRLNPQKFDCDQLILVTTNTWEEKPFWGNLLLDNCTDIKKVTWGDAESFWGFNFPDFSLSNTVALMPSPDKIMLKNPSFERTEDIDQPFPRFWDDLGGEMESPPDIQPGSFSVFQEPQEGRQFVGLVTRANGTREVLGQQLLSKMAKGASYTFSIALARSASYSSMTRKGKVEDFTNPVLLRIWGVNTQTAEKELLAQTVPVKHTQWVTYDFKLRPTKSDVDYFVLEAWFDMRNGHPYNGNLLIDNCSAIEKTSK